MHDAALSDPAVAALEGDLRSAVTLPETPWPRGAWLEVLTVKHLLWSPYTLAIPNLPPALVGLRILHLTDLHTKSLWSPAWDALHERIRQNPPDLILITGDFVEVKFDSRSAIPILKRLLEPLQARLGVWGILGNHDGDVLALPLADTHVRLLVNEAVTLESGGATLEIVGVHGVNRHDLSPRAQDELPSKSPGAVRLLMAHYPDQMAQLASLKADVCFSGHTHGGQVALPGGWPLLTHDGLPKRFSKGVHRIGQTWLVVGRGLGFSMFSIRTFCPVEAIEITLAAK